MAEQRVIVVGGGLAGLAASVRIAEAGVPVDLFSMCPVKRSHSVCAQGGINACNEVARQQGYSEYQHFDETIYGGDYLADQAPVLEMANWAPRIIDLLDRMGVPFNRTNEGRRDLRLFGGSLFKRTHFAGATTGQQLLYALDEQTRRHEDDGKITKYEWWEFLWPVLEGEGSDARCVGIVAQDMRTMQIRAFRGAAVVMATGGNGLIFGQSTNSVICTGGAASRCYQAGAWYGNAEMIQVHPTAIPGADKCRLMSESARGEGGRVWVPRKAGDARTPKSIPDAERWYFLEERYPKYGNLVPRDIATREIFDVCVNEKMGVGGGNMVYLDLTHKDPDYLTRKLGGIMDIYEKFAGDDPRFTPMKIFPAVHYTMGGMWTTYAPGSYTPATPHGEHKPGMVPPVDTEVGRGMAYGDPRNMSTNIPGLYAFGEVNFAYHGATRLGANALLSCIFDGLFCGVGVVNHVNDAGIKPVEDVPQSVYDAVVRQEEAKCERLIASAGTGDGPAHNAYIIGKEMGEVMTSASTVVKTEKGLENCLGKLDELRNRYANVSLSDTATWTNQALSYARAVGDMLVLAEAIAKAGLLRKESRGSHYRTDYQDRDDENFWRASVSRFNPQTGKADVSFEEVKAGLVEPRARTYGKQANEDKSENKQEVAASAS
ncbi:MAG: succinate dehydrogenase flavoprotein subunit [Phycisphaeraceae bacterium]|nr:MAG: succinate dehydrogenase flavoprotein subunit [Phycisphaeraceae bacterium]